MALKPSTCRTHTRAIFISLLHSLDKVTQDKCEEEVAKFGKNMNLVRKTIYLRSTIDCDALTNKYFFLPCYENSLTIKDLTMETFVFT